MAAVADRTNQRQLPVIDYLREETWVLHGQPGDKRLRFSDDQRRLLAAKAKGLGRKLLAEVATIVASQTPHAWYRELIAQGCDGKSARYVRCGGGWKPAHGSVGAVVLRGNSVRLGINGLLTSL